jgi:hypothetical protein
MASSTGAAMHADLEKTASRRLSTVPDETLLTSDADAELLG